MDLAKGPLKRPIPILKKPQPLISTESSTRRCPIPTWCRRGTKEPPGWRFITPTQYKSTVQVWHPSSQLRNTTTCREAHLIERDFLMSRSPNRGRRFLRGHIHTYIPSSSDGLLQCSSWLASGSLPRSRYRLIVMHLEFSSEGLSTCPTRPTRRLMDVTELDTLRHVAVLVCMDPVQPSDWSVLHFMLAVYVHRINNCLMQQVKESTSRSHTDLPTVVFRRFRRRCCIDYVARCHPLSRPAE